MGGWSDIWGELRRTARDLLPVVAVVVAFQLAVIGAEVPNLGRKLGGLLLVLFGLTFFVRGLSMSLIPLGESLALGLARHGNLGLLLGFAFAMGFGSTIAEPALHAVLVQAAAVVADETQGQEAFVLGARVVISVGVGLAVAVGVLRIVLGWPVWWFVLGGYGLAGLLALPGDSPLQTIAFDAGAAATSAINIPLIMALGIGLATVLSARSPLADGFGLVALASLTPMLLILIGAVWL